MKQVTLTELRNHARQYFDLVETGETVRVLRNGKPIAAIVPIPQGLPSWKRRMAVIGVLSLVMVVGFALNSHAEEFADKAKLAAIQKYFKIVPVEEAMHDMAVKVAQTLPEKQRAAYIELMTKKIDMKPIESAMKKSMYKHFTIGEIKLMNDFYSKPEGKSIMKKMGDYMADILPVIQGEFKRIFKEQEKTSTH